MSVQK